MRVFHAKVEWLYKGRYPKSYETRGEASSLPAAAAMAARAWKKEGLQPREICRQATIRVTLA